MPQPCRRFLSPTGWLHPGAWAVLTTLIVQAALGPWCRADPPSGIDRASPEAATNLPSGATSNPSDLEDRLRRLEALGAAVQEQNRRLTEQNRQLAEQNRTLADQLQEMSRRHEELSRRLDRVASPPTPLAVEPDQSEDPAWTKAPVPAPEVLFRDGPPGEPEFGKSRFLVGGYDQEKDRFVLVKPRDSERTPFDLITELRYTGFSRSAQT